MRSSVPGKQPQQAHVAPRNEPGHAASRTPQISSPRSDWHQLQYLIGNQGMRQLLQNTTARSPPVESLRPAPQPVPSSRYAEAQSLAQSGVASRLGTGAPLPQRVREEAQQRFQLSLGDVRIHDHPAAHRLAQRHLARAFTVGADIVFNAGRYQPGSGEGRRLLAHELAHVVQQRGAAGSMPGRAHETAADAAARALTQGATGTVHAGPAAARSMQCEPLDEDDISRLDLDHALARIKENEQEVGLVIVSEDYRKRLAKENILLKARIYALVKSGQTKPNPPEPATPQQIEVMQQIRQEMQEVRPIVMKMGADVPLNPKDFALNAVKNVGVRLENDRQFLANFLPMSGPFYSDVKAAARQVDELQSIIKPTIGAAIRWHDDNPAGKSLGMMNEEAGTWLAGKGSEHWEKGGWYYISGGAAYVGAFGVAFLDAGEKMFSFGFHDAATAVSEAYTRGDISWNEGEEILNKAAWRALLTAAITRGVGAGASRLGTGAAQLLRLAPEGLPSGLVSGGVTGGLTTVATLGSQDIVTRSLQDGLNSPAGKAIWNQGIPSGKEWAIAIPLGILLGGLGGVKAVQFGNKNLLGSIVDTPSGPCRVVAITRSGQVVLEPVGGLTVATPPPPASAITMIFDPVSKSWVMPKGAAASPVPVPAAAKPNTPSPKPATAIVKVKPAAPKPLAPTAKKPALPPPPLKDPVPTATPESEGLHVEIKPAETTPSALKPEDVKVPATKATDIKPADIKPSDVKAPDVKPLELKPPELKPVEAKPEAKPIDVKPTAVQEAEAKAAETKLADTQPAAQQAAPAKPTPAKPPSKVAHLADKRVADSQQALSSAQKETAAAQASLTNAESELQAARELAATDPRNPTGKAWLQKAQSDAHAAEARLAAAEKSEAVATREAQAVVRGRAEVAKLEAEISALDKQITAELHPPGGFTKAQLQEGRRLDVVPRAPSVEPSGAMYHELAAQRAAALRKLEEETAGLTRTIAEQVEAATPGKTARPVALANAAQLDPELRPTKAGPIDVTTGKPMKTTSWATDHIMSRSEIARDPRFARLTPQQRDAMLLEVPENYLPMTVEANSSKGALSVDEWIAAREASNQPLPKDMARVLRAADVRARLAIEAKFKQFLGE